MLNKKKVYILLGAVVCLMVVIEVLFAHPHYHMVWNEVPGFDLIIGFAGAWFLIILAKKIMAGMMQREENYYEQNPVIELDEDDLEEYTIHSDHGEDVSNGMYETCDTQGNCGKGGGAHA